MSVPWDLVPSFFIVKQEQCEKRYSRLHFEQLCVLCSPFLKHCFGESWKEITKKQEGGRRTGEDAQTQFCSWHQQLLHPFLPLLPPSLSAKQCQGFVAHTFLLCHYKWCCWWACLQMCLLCVHQVRGRLDKVLSTLPVLSAWDCLGISSRSSSARLFSHAKSILRKQKPQVLLYSSRVLLALEHCSHGSGNVFISLMCLYFRENRHVQLILICMLLEPIWNYVSICAR